MKHILASQLTHGDANMATFFIPCNYSDRACHLHTRINMTTGSQEKTLHVWTELARKVIGPFVDPGKARPCQSLPPFISTQKPPVRLLPAGYCWSDLCLVTWTAMRYEAIVSPSKQTRLSGLTRNYSSTWKLQWNEEVFLLHWIFAGRCPNLGGRSLLSSARSDVWFVLCVRVYLW